VVFAQICSPLVIKNATNCLCFSSDDASYDEDYPDDFEEDSEGSGMLVDNLVRSQT